MESIGRIFRKLSDEECQISSDQLVMSSWPGAVGKNIAKRTRAAKMVRKRLVVEVEDQILQQQLFVMQRHILANLELKVGPGLVDELFFKVAPRRMEPQRATSSLPSLDEADRIADPVMRQIYKSARRKESA
jgi:hypothetical protein